jgi:VIT1/CCC1 family predicted Fe2+/Mn2+ transporter
MAASSPETLAPRAQHREGHFVTRIGWLRAAVLGANDGIVSTGALIVGVAASHADKRAILIAGLAGLVAGAMSMAAGEYVSVSSQADTEQADLAREKQELRDFPEEEHKELVQIYVERGLDPKTAELVATELMAKDAIGAHARDELGISEVSVARPIQAAATSAATFSAGALLPLAAAFVSPPALLLPEVALTAILVLAGLGVLGASAGGASMLRGSIRVTFWSALAMGLTAAIGALFGSIS